MINKVFEKQKNKDIIFVLTGFGLGDLFNFGFHILPKFLQKYKYVHIITDYEENILKYEKKVIWHFSVNDKEGVTDQTLKEYSGRIDRIVYLDNHAEFLKALKSLAKKHGVHLSYPHRTLINKLIRAEKGFYFNIYIKMTQILIPLAPQFKKSIRLYGKNEKTTYSKYFTHHSISNEMVNIVIIPESRKKIKSISPTNLLSIIKWFIKITPNCNIFIISRNPDYLLPNTYHLDSLTAPEVCYFITKSNICISVDTGFIHVANFLKKNIMGLFGPTNCQSSLYSQENVLEMSNIVQKKRCPFYQNNVYLNPCMKIDRCNICK